MVPFFKSPYTTASSASVEGEFSQLKNSILKHESRLLSADRFVVTHLRSIENDMKIVRSEQIYPTKKLLVDDSLENITADDLNTNDVISSTGNLTSSLSTTSISDDDTFNTEECLRGLKNIKTGPLINSREKNIQIPSTPKKKED